jgi:sulfur-carrier protein
MPVVTIPTPLRAHSGGRDRIEAPGSTVREVLAQVTEQFPELRDRIFKGGEVPQFVNVYVNSEDIRFLDDLDTPVGENDTIDIIPSIAGG